MLTPQKWQKANQKVRKFVFDYFFLVTIFALQWSRKVLYKKQFVYHLVLDNKSV